jgi:hypothetical protein
MFSPIVNLMRGLMLPAKKPKTIGTGNFRVSGITGAAQFERAIADTLNRVP